MTPLAGAPADPFERLRAAPRGEPVALLHSCGMAGPDGGERPALWFGSPIDRLTIPGDAPALDGAFARIDAFLDRHRELPVVGFLGFDLRDAVEPLPRSIPDDLALPAIDLVAHRRVERFPDAPPPAPVPGLPACTSVAPHVARADYERRVARVVEHIRAGDVFQVNLTQPFTAQWRGDPRALFQQLCAVGPAPFAAYLETGDGLAVLSGSPEEFLYRDGNSVRTRPIKGTRRRGSTPADDERLLAELLASDKDLAELAMIVDLLRNDLGRVARVGSVHVGPFPEHASFAQVHHLFATVRAELRDGVTTGELLRATFPGGSVTGAPKLRCLEIIEELEVVRRGVYTGAVGWFGPGARLHLNIAIRTMVATADGRLRLNAGGGVTADSDPAAEYEETLHKAAGMLRALGTDVDAVRR
ncbi:MAG: aminodeoxychorismate synthase component I [Planctomycetes bacterium]|nr:aminodeoxychorismate synthase component I [Planctomycetota bacterium]